jgi:hypothetical protein
MGVRVHAASLGYHAQATLLGASLGYHAQANLQHSMIYTTTWDL